MLRALTDGGVFVAKGGFGAGVPGGIEVDAADWKFWGNLSENSRDKTLSGARLSTIMADTTERKVK